MKIFAGLIALSAAQDFPRENPHSHFWFTDATDSMQGSGSVSEVISVRRGFFKIFSVLMASVLMELNCMSKTKRIKIILETKITQNLSEAFFKYLVF